MFLDKPPNATLLLRGGVARSFRNFVISDLRLGLNTTNSSVLGTNLHESTRLDFVCIHVICVVRP